MPTRPRGSFEFIVTIPLDVAVIIVNISIIIYSIIVIITSILKITIYITTIISSADIIRCLPIKLAFSFIIINRVIVFTIIAQA